MALEFVDLHSHTTYSFLDGMGRVGQHYARAKELGRTAMAITDHDNVSSFALLKFWGDHFGIKPIYGCEIRIVPSIPKMREEASRKKNHMTVLAESSEGIKNICRMMTRAWDEGFYYYPTVDMSMLMEHSEGLIVLSGCVQGIIADPLVQDDYEEAGQRAEAMKKFFGDRFYLEIMPHELDIAQKAASGLARLSKELDIPTVMTADAHFIMADQRDVWRTLNCIRRRIPWQDGHDMVETAYLMSVEELLDFSLENLPDLGKTFIEHSIERSLEIAGRCNAEQNTPQRLLYRPNGNEFDVESDNPQLALLKKWCVEGFHGRGIKIKGEYKERCQRELKLIEEKDFTDYLLIIADLVRWAKEKDIFVGPARGSSAGSLVCYLIGITEVDPIPYRLMFERFISVDRYDPPDIDIDFEDNRREEVRNYLIEKYGRERVSGVITFAEFKRRNTIDDICKVFKVPADVTNQLKAIVFDRKYGDSRTSLAIADLFNKFDSAREIAERYPIAEMADLLEGNFRHWSQHAAGVMISEDPLTDTVALYTRGDRQVISADWHRMELMNVMKIDLLGLRELRVLRWMAEAAGITKEEMYQIDVTDEKVLEGFKKRDILGIFQLDGGSTFSLIKQMEPAPQSLEDISLLSALARPGPLHSGSTQMYMDARQKGERHEWDHPVPDHATEYTNGFIIYQEQVMEICRDLGLMEWTSITELRKAMAKTLGTQNFDKHVAEFYAGCKKMGASDKLAHDLWVHMLNFGSFGFNKSHSISYGIISFYAMWFKVHHPDIFYWGAIAGEPDTGKRRAYMREYIARGGKMLPPTIGKSKRNFTRENGYIRGGLEQVRGIGGKAAALLAESKSTDVEQLGAEFPRRIINKTVKDAIKLHDLFGDDTRDYYNLYAMTRELAVTPFTHKINDMKRLFTSFKATVTGRVTRRNLKSAAEVKATQIKSKMGGRTHVDDMDDDDEWMLLNLQDDTGTINVHLKGNVWKEAKDFLLSPEFDKHVVIFKGTVPANNLFLIAHSFEVWHDEGIKRPLANCLTCPLAEAAFVPPDLNGSPIAFVAEAPGYNETLQLKPLVGAAGVVIQDIVREEGYQREDFDYQNAALCRPVKEGNKNRTPTEIEIEACNDRLLNEIKGYEVVIALGRTAYIALTGDTATKVGEFTGMLTEAANGVKVIPTYHPAAALHRSGENEAIKSAIRSSVQRAIQMTELETGEFVNVEEIMEADL